MSRTVKWDEDEVVYEMRDGDGCQEKNLASPHRRFIRSPGYPFPGGSSSFVFHQHFKNRGVSRVAAAIAMSSA
jgi:hypothetical protein